MNTLQRPNKASNLTKEEPQQTPTFSCFPTTKETTVMNTSATLNMRTNTKMSGLIYFLQKPLFLYTGPLPSECTTLKNADNLTATYLGIPFFWLIHNEDGNCNMSVCVKRWENYTHDMSEITHYGHEFYRFWEHEMTHYQKFESFESTYCVIK